MAGSSHIHPNCLTVPGRYGSGPDHWQSRWERRGDVRRVDLGAWDNPHRSHWITKLDLAIAYEREPVILVAHSLGCLAVAWWCALASADRRDQVAGALLVAPPDVERPDAHPILRRFAPAPRMTFPFPAIVAASTDDPYAAIARAHGCAARWGADFRDVGALGHINADSGLGEWPEGQAMLVELGAAPPNAAQRSASHLIAGRRRFPGEAFRAK
jgi:predicted alpha/beta hydrolase family esterase